MIIESSTLTLTCSSLQRIYCSFIVQALLQVKLSKWYYPNPRVKLQQNNKNIILNVNQHDSCHQQIRFLMFFINQRKGILDINKQFNLYEGRRNYQSQRIIQYLLSKHHFHIIFRQDQCLLIKKQCPTLNLKQRDWQSFYLISLCSFIVNFSFMLPQSNKRRIFLAAILQLAEKGLFKVFSSCRILIFLYAILAVGLFGGLLGLESSLFVFYGLGTYWLSSLMMGVRLEGIQEAVVLIRREQMVGKLQIIGHKQMIILYRINLWEFWSLNVHQSNYYGVLGTQNKIYSNPLSNYLNTSI